MPRGLVSGVIVAGFVRAPTFKFQVSTDHSNSRQVNIASRERPHRIREIGTNPANRIPVCDWYIVPDELSAAGLIVPEPSVTPSPFAVWAEYMAADRAM
jgi:hypothetical protein